MHNAARRTLLAWGLSLALGGNVWFLKGKARWEAWPGQDLEKRFPREDTDDRDPSDVGDH